jgi:hypothetical protein
MVEKILAALKQYTNLGEWGMNCPTLQVDFISDRESLIKTMGNNDSFVDSIQTCCNWLDSHNIDYMLKRNKGRNSYGFKHDVEDWSENFRASYVYVSNGAFIISAIIHGYVPLQMDQSPNCKFKKVR